MQSVFELIKTSVAGKVDLWGPSIDRSICPPVLSTREEELPVAPPPRGLRAGGEEALVGGFGGGGAMETYRRRRSGDRGVWSSCVAAVTLAAAAALWVGMVAQCVVADHEEVSLGAAVANSKYFRHMTFPNHQVEGVVSTERRTERAESNVSSVHLCLFCLCDIVRQLACSGCVVVVLWVPCLVAFLLPFLFGVLWSN